jgi:tetratricopeptide (TPR) repeat protein
MRKSLILYVLFVSAILISCGEKNDNAAVNTGEENLDSLLSVYPDSVPLLVKRAKMDFDEFDFTSALADAAKAFRLDSNNVEARAIFAEVLNNRPDRSVADISNAQRHYHVLIKKDPKDLRSLVGLASTYSQQQEYETSFKYINEALRIDPKYRDAYVLKGTNYRMLGERDLMKSSWETAIQQDPEFYFAHIMLGALYEADSNDLCLQYYKTASDLEPGNMEAVYALAFANHRFGNIDEAKVLYRQMATDTSDHFVSRGLFHQGYIKQFTEMEIDSAVYYYKSALVTNPQYPEAWCNLGMSYASLGEQTQALQSYAKALKYARQFGYKEEFVQMVEKEADKSK